MNRSHLLLCLLIYFLYFSLFQLNNIRCISRQNISKFYNMQLYTEHEHLTPRVPWYEVDIKLDLWSQTIPLSLVFLLITI